MYIKKLKSLTQELRRAIAAFRYELTDKGEILVPKAKVLIGGVFTSEVLRHEYVQKAIDSGDKDKIAHVRNHILRLGLHYEGYGYFPMQEAVDTNIVPDAGVNFVLNLICGTTPKQSNWYQGLISQNATPNSSWGAGWSGITAHMADEFPDTTVSGGTGNHYTGSGRRATSFAAASNRVIASSSAASFVMGTGTADVSIYGSTLNTVATVNWDGASGYLLSAARFSSPKTGLGAADVLNVSYELRGSSV